MIISINAEKALGEVDICLNKNSQQTRSIYPNQLYFYVQITKYQKIKNLKYIYSSSTNKRERKNLTKDLQNIYKEKHILREKSEIFYYKGGTYHIYGL